VSGHRPGWFRGAGIVARHELRLLFLAPTGWVFLAAIAFFAGAFLSLGLVTTGEASLRVTLGNLSVTLAFCIPLVTMGQLAGEARSGTDLQWRAAPVSAGSVVVGKWLGALALCGGLLVVLLPLPAVLVLYGAPDPGVLLTTTLGLLACCAAFFAAGLFASSLTADPIVAAVGGVMILLPSWLASVARDRALPAVAAVLDRVAFPGHLHSFAVGVIDTGDLVWFAVVTAAFLVLARQVVGRRARRGATAVLVAVLVVCALSVVAEEAHRHRARWDWSVDGRNTLTAETHAALAALLRADDAVRITAFGAQDRDGEGPERDRAVHDMLAELAHASDRVTWQAADLDRDRLLAQQLGVTRHGTLVVAGAHDRVLLEDRALFRGRGSAVSFTGEAAVGGAVRTLAAGGARTVVLLAGHGEARLWDRGVGTLRGVAELLAEQGWDARTIDLSREPLPAETSAVLMVGPRTPTAPPEDTVLREYLAGGGGLAVFVDPGGALPGVVGQAGVSLGTGVALDATSVLPHTDRPVLRTATHPMTEGMRRGGAQPVLALAAPVRGGASLLTTSARGWVEHGSEDPAAYTPGEDEEGPVVVAAALSVGAGRVVVVGDADLLTDALLAEAPGNAVFLRSVVRWVSGSEEPGTGGGRPAVARRVALTPTQLAAVRWGLMGGTPALLLALGLAVRRRRGS